MTKLTQAFKELRKLGYLARQSFMCCSGCAGYALTTEAEARVERGKTVRGCVFYHKQDADHFKESQDGKLTIRFGSMSSTKNGTIGIDDLEIGKEVVRVFTACSIRTEWDGDSHRCIEAYPEEEADKESASHSEATPTEKPTVKLLAEDGNAFFILGRCHKSAKRAGWSEDKIATVMAELKGSNNYGHLLQKAMEHFEVV